jgi:hypothetical protein
VYFVFKKTSNNEFDGVVGVVVVVDDDALVVANTKQEA